MSNLLRLEQEPEANLLIFGAGPIGSCEPNFMRELAETIGAKIIDNAVVMPGVVSGEYSLTKSETDHAIAALSLKHLLRNDDVVVGPVIKPTKQRKKILLPVASVTDAITVGLNFEVTQRAAVERISRWIYEDGYCFADGTNNPEAGTTKFRRSKGRTSYIDDKEAEHFYTIDGNLEMTDMLKQVAGYLRQDGLID